MPDRQVSGFAAPGFERVLEVLSTASLDSGGGAFAAFVGDEPVVDVWAGCADTGVPWQRETVACAYSASKGVVTSCLVALHHDGMLDVDAPVARYWREFGAAGKERITVRQLLSHSAGLPGVPGYQGFLGIRGENWGCLEEVRSRLAGAAPVWEPGEEHGYHGLTFGYLAGALVHRLTGMEVPEFFLARLGTPWQLDVRFGVTAETDGRRARQLLAAPLSPELAAASEPYRQMARDPETLLGKAFWAQDGTTVLEHLDVAGTDPACMNVGAGNGDVIASARGLADLYRQLASSELGSSLMSFAQVHRRGPDLVLGGPATWCVGFQGNDVSVTGGLGMGPTLAAFGHHGAGGQLAGYDPEHRLAFAFLRNQLSPVSTVAADLVAAVTAAL